MGHTMERVECDLADELSESDGYHSVTQEGEGEVAHSHFEVVPRGLAQLCGPRSERSASSHSVMWLP